LEKLPSRIYPYAIKGVVKLVFHKSRILDDAGVKTREGQRNARGCAQFFDALFESSRCPPDFYISRHSLIREDVDDFVHRAKRVTPPQARNYLLQQDTILV
jgi:hypothetical protein